ncbi:MAG: GNAT superfamily N-acetyltransferase [Vicingaceae bacterium]|jgi:GNAT superfamily N-acetyltransferase
MDFVIREGYKADCLRTLELIRELAEYEKAPGEVAVSLKDLEEDGFGENSIYKLFVAEQNDEIIGIAIFYEKYSTWKGKCIYLEDLIVTESKRGLGAGKALFEAVIEFAKENNSGRMEWQVLDWNTPAIDFYKSYNAELDGTWYNGRFTKEQLQNINL